MAEDDLWETHAGWWQAGFTEGADAEYTEQILPLAAEHLAGAGSVLDVGAGEGQVARLAAAGGAAGRTTSGGTPPACRWRAVASTRWWPAWCSSTSGRPTPPWPRWVG